MRNSRVAYVDRNDSDVDARESQSFSQGDYDLTRTVSPASSGWGAEQVSLLCLFLDLRHHFALRSRTWRC